MIAILYQNIITRYFLNILIFSKNLLLLYIIRRPWRNFVRFDASSSKINTIYRAILGHRLSNKSKIKYRSKEIENCNDIKKCNRRHKCGSGCTDGKTYDTGQIMYTAP